MKNDDEINICFCSDENLIEYIPVVLNSILSRNSNYKKECSKQKIKKLPQTCFKNNYSILIIFTSNCIFADAKNKCNNQNGKSNNTGNRKKIGIIRV